MVGGYVAQVSQQFTFIGNKLADSVVALIGLAREVLGTLFAHDEVTFVSCNDEPLQAEFGRDVMGQRADSQNTHSQC